MDKWIQLGIIEPSKSPWAAPVLIVYQNGKLCMVIDYQKLNEIAISDEFPLPKQEDILGNSSECPLATRMVLAFSSTLCKMS